LIEKRFVTYSFSKYLRINNKSSDEFEFMLNRLSLEEVIALKLELSARGINGKLYGLNIWNNLPKLIKESLLLFAVSATTNIVEAQTLLGVADTTIFRKILYKYKDSLRYYKAFEFDNRKYLKKVIR
jgi:hypothetical protein